VHDRLAKIQAGAADYNGLCCSLPDRQDDMIVAAKLRRNKELSRGGAKNEAFHQSCDEQAA
jgi:hypothetical protein